MIIQIDGVKTVNPNSLFGKLIKLVGAKSWCALGVYLGLWSIPALLYMHGLLVLVGISEYVEGGGFIDFLKFANAGATIIATIFGMVFLAVWGCNRIPTLNKWLQNSCTQINFETEEKDGSTD